MPFKSSKQSNACFATGGFGGKINCKEWADKTDYKTLPKSAPKKGINSGMHSNSKK